MFLQKTALMMLVTVLLVQQAHGKSEKDGDAFSSWFGHMSAAGPVLHFNDEGSPYRFALGVGHPVFLNELSFIATAAYSYYDVNAVADNNPSLNIKGGNSHSLGLDLLLRWSFLQTPHASYHFEGGAGFQYMLTDPPFPADGSNENFTLFFGPGILIPTGIDKRISVSLQWFHLSNANLFPKNSGYDGLQLVVGFEWAL